MNVNKNLTQYSFWVSDNWEKNSLEENGFLLIELPKRAHAVWPS